MNDNGIYKCTRCGEIIDRDLIRCTCGNEKCIPINNQTKKFESYKESKYGFYNWIGPKIVLLSSRLGPFKVKPGDNFSFEPTPGFYGFIAQGTTDALNEAMKMLANHLQIRTCPIIEEWSEKDGPLVTLNYDWTADTKPPGLIKYKGVGHSRVSLNITNKHSHYVMGAILAHELTHYYLYSKNIILSDEIENEFFTDLATCFLGLGKLTLNGYEPLRWTTKKGDVTHNYEYRVGYMNTLEMSQVMAFVMKMRSISTKSVESNVLDENVDKIKCSIDKYSRYSDKKMREGEYECLKCNKYTEYFLDDRDELVCKNCGIEWNDAIYIYKRKMRINPMNWFKKEKKLELYPLI